MTEEEFEEKYKEVIDIINNTHTSLMVEDFVEDMYLKIKQQQKEIKELEKENIELINQRTEGFWENDRLKKEIERLNQEIRKWAEKEHNLTQALLSKRTNSISKDKIMEIAKEYIEDETIDLHLFYMKVMRLLEE